jgi:Ca2+-binding EF-hand superfamily protein
MKQSNGLILSVLLAAAMPVVAQSYDRLDRNRDGQITRQEWRGSMQQFRDRDWNRDGVLTGDEISGRRDESSRNRSSASGTSAMNNLDSNNSGRVEGYEWPYNANIFHQLDRNGDSVLSQNELRNMDRATLRDLDQNRNGRIDDNEWPGGFAQFDRLDQNNDGRVSANEYMERGGEWQRRSRFDIWDTNQDSRLSMNEWKSSATLFRRLDKNRDNVVDWSEYQSNTDRYDRPNGWR